jgi:large subunit ribosomal protein L25
MHAKGKAMSTDTYELTAEARDRVGKGSARAIRRNGKIPAVIYGDKKDPVSITLPYKEVNLRIHSGGFLTTVATIDVDGEKYKVLPKDFQVDPVTDFPLHVDFLRIGANTIVTVMIPIHFTNEEESPGLTRGGVLNVVRHEVEVHCRADIIPDYFEADLTGLDIEDVVHVSAIAIPDGVELTITDRDFTICSIAAPTIYTESEEGEEAEGEEEETEEIEGEEEKSAEEEGEE